MFLANVWKEADGKELKIANSQTSRLLERLILLSSPDQLKGLFQKFSGKCVLNRSFPIQPANPSQLPQPGPAPEAGARGVQGLSRAGIRPLRFPGGKTCPPAA